MARLSEHERAERRMMRTRLEALSVKRLREFAKERGVDLHGAKTKLCVINTIMNNYDRWKEKA